MYMFMYVVQVRESRHTYIYGSFMQMGLTAPTPEYLYHTVFAGHDNDEFNVVRDSSSNFSTWSFRIKCAKKQRASHFSALIEAAERISLLHIFTFEVNRRGEREKHEKDFFALPGERMLFGGQHGAPGAKAKAAAAAVTYSRDLIAAATGFDESIDPYETEPDSDTECSPAGGAPSPKRARITGASPASVPLAYMQSEIEHARASEAATREWARTEVDRARTEAETREAEWKAETKRAREETERERRESKEEIARLRAAVEREREEAERVRAEFEAFRVERAANTGGNKRRVQIVLDHAKAHYDRLASFVSPPAALQLRDVQASGCFTVRHCESLLLQQQPDLKDSGARAREVFRLATHGRFLPPTGMRGKAHGVEVFFAEGAVAFYSGEGGHGVKWERDNGGEWRVTAQV
jgi:hypothetical protein